METELLRDLIRLVAVFGSAIVLALVFIAALLTLWMSDQKTR